MDDLWALLSELEQVFFHLERREEEFCAIDD